MSNDVFANGRELACKAGSGKSIAAFPDVCMTPPENPATPPGVPVPYPNTGMASDTTDGSTTVKISGKEVTLKNKSYFKKSSGDEAGAAAKKGVVSSVNRGKAYFTAWSMDVKIEGENAVRHLDMTTHNHGSPMNTGPMIFQDRMALINASSNCTKEKEAIDDACGDPLDERAKCPDQSAVRAAKANQRAVQAAHGKGSPQRTNAQAILNAAHEQHANAVKEDDCHRALRCALTPYADGKNKAKPRCCPPQTPEHLIPASQFGAKRGTKPGRYTGGGRYRAGRAACMCADGGAQAATHGLLGAARHEHMLQRGIVDCSPTTSERWTVGQAAECGGASVEKVTGGECSADCIKEQLLINLKQMGIDQTDTVAPVQSEDGQGLSGFAAEIVGG